MKRRLALLLPLALAACQDNSTMAPGALAPGNQLNAINLSQTVEQVMPGEVIVKARAGQDVAEIARAHGLEVASTGYRGTFSVLRGAAGSERALAARLGADARVEYAEPNFLRQPQAIDSRLWAFFNDGSGRMYFTSGSNRGSAVGSKLPKADADEDNIAGYAAGGAPVVIGSVDTGVDLDHPEFLSGQLIAGRDWYNNDANPQDDEGHGTHTTGTMVGRNVGVAGVSGAGANVRVYVQKVCGRRGCPTSAIVSAIRAAADYPGLVAMNLSLGGSSESQSEKDAIAYANGKGVLVIASAGNDGTSTVSCPACDPLAISVAATNWADGLSYYSNWGTGLDIAAPGGEMYSNTSDEGGIYSSVIDGYDYYQGTSMAAPQVTGTAGIVASVTGLRGSALRSRLEGSTDDVGTPGYDTTFGNGRLNSYRAVTGSSLAAGQ
jgi:serine protease